MYFPGICYTQLWNKNKYEIQEIKINNNPTIVVLWELSQEHSTESRSCIYKLSANQNQENEDADNNMNIKLTEQHQEDNGYSLADTTDSNNYSSSENEEEFLEDLTVELNGTTPLLKHFSRSPEDHHFWLASKRFEARGDFS